MTATGVRDDSPNLLLIGIGPGDPKQITIEAIEAMREADVFFVLDKGEHKHTLLALRREICERYIPEGGYRFVEIPDPPRDRHPDDYTAEVRAWHDGRLAKIEEAFAAELADGQVGAFLVWGDPALYDSTLRIVEQIAEAGRFPVRYRVIPAVSSISALAASHRILLNRIGEPIHITTGRRLLLDRGGDTNQVVMLDSGCSFLEVAEPDDHIWWGAYLGTDEEILICGTVAEVGQLIKVTREEARIRIGWILDVYLLRKPEYR
jgi:precorrin-6A synthase